MQTTLKKNFRIEIKHKMLKLAAVVRYSLFNRPQKRCITNGRNDKTVFGNNLLSKANEILTLYSGRRIAEFPRGTIVFMHVTLPLVREEWWKENEHFFFLLLQSRTLIGPEVSEDKAKNILAFLGFVFYVKEVDGKIDLIEVDGLREAKIGELIFFESGAVGQIQSRAWGIVNAIMLGGRKDIKPNDLVFALGANKETRRLTRECGGLKFFSVFILFRPHGNSVFFISDFWSQYQIQDVSLMYNFLEGTGVTVVFFLSSFLLLFLLAARTRKKNYKPVKDQKGDEALTEEELIKKRQDAYLKRKKEADSRMKRALLIGIIAISLSLVSPHFFPLVESGIEWLLRGGRGPASGG